jgi:hypothetical protein
VVFGAVGFGAVVFAGFGVTAIDKTTAITITGDAILGIPIGGTHGAGVRPFVSGGFGLMRSTDAGDSWASPAAGSSFSPLAFDPLTAGALYFGSGNQILRSTDYGATFVPLSSLPNQAGVIAHQD